VPIRAVCVYCGSSSGLDPTYAAAARELGALLARNDISLIYGGGSVGLMGVLADEALARGGRGTGVIPRGLFSREIAHTGLTALHEVDSMHERKLRMFELADAFVALPGGLGTLEELAEITTWAQLGLHRKPIVLLDVNSYWSGLVDLLDHAVHEGFLRDVNRALLTRVPAVADIMNAIDRYAAPTVPKWIDSTET
jgi:uncharacterized protein (TIGR00730 family)